ncbi:putative protein N(5)-glutamine methyltransferase [Nocardia lasii]|uniref:peptide chain release factor N(5)-glutamine methyltransferase n=1 Tax=Nocardia lasii TaxID=1616107 RepID=A0ABW1JRN1_9NOCA
MTALYNSAQQHFTNGDDVAGRADLRALIAADPHDTEALALHAIRSHYAGDTAAVGDALTRLGGLDPAMAAGTHDRFAPKTVGRARDNQRMSSSVLADVVGALRRAGCVFAEDEAALLLDAAAGDQHRLDALVGQRVSGTPLEYLLGWVEFRGMRVRVRPGVFVPRQRTAFLVEQAVIATTATRVCMVDLCCGCGALGLSATTELTARGCAVELVAADIDPVAVACARENLAALHAPVFGGDLFDALPGDLRGRVDLLLANTPYVPSARVAQLPPEAREYEPLVALDGGEDGLDVFRRVAAGAAQWLAPGGRVLVEIGAGQVETACAVLTAHGLASRVARSRDHYATVVIGTP